MRSSLRSRSTLAPAALAALSLAVCLSAGQSAPALNERRALQEHEQAVASLIACLEAAAKSLAGQAATLPYDDAGYRPLTTCISLVWQPSDEQPRVSPQTDLSRLNLPPPALLS